MRFKSNNSNKFVHKFLESFQFYNKLAKNTLTIFDIKKILINAFQKYFQKEISLDILLLVAIEIQDEIMGYDHLEEKKLMQVLCGLSDIYFNLIPKESIEKELKEIFQLLITFNN
jgi:hypothetical protein